jgi:hypothetical protein
VDGQFSRYIRDHEGTLFHLSADVWSHIWARHPELVQQPEVIEDTLHDPDEIRRSRKRQETLLYYKQFDTLHVASRAIKQRLVCVVVDQDEHEVKTAYITSRIKQGERLWRRG